MTKSRLIFIIIFLIVIGIQFIEVDKTNPRITADIETPMEIKTLLTRSCYDCHSNETKWPWYSKVAPVNWLIAGDVNEGRENLNFSDWEKLTTDKQQKLISKIVEELDSGDMPPRKYTIMHPSAALTLEQEQVLKKWFQQSNQ